MKIPDSQRWLSVHRELVIIRFISQKTSMDQLQRNNHNLSLVVRESYQSKSIMVPNWVWSVISLLVGQCLSGRISSLQCCQGQSPRSQTRPKWQQTSAQWRGSPAPWECGGCETCWWCSPPTSSPPLSPGGLCLLLLRNFHPKKIESINMIFSLYLPLGSSL